MQPPSTAIDHVCRSGGTGGRRSVVTPRTKTSYWVRVENDCNSVDSGAAEVTVFCTGPSIARRPQFGEHQTGPAGDAHGRRDGNPVVLPVV